MGGELQLAGLAAVQYVGQGEPDACGKKAPGGMQHGVPEGDLHVERVYLAQDFRREDEAQDDAFEHAGNVDGEPALKHAGNPEQYEHQQAEQRILVAPLEDRAHENAAHDQAKHHIEREHARLFLRRLAGVGQKTRNNGHRMPFLGRMIFGDDMPV